MEYHLNKVFTLMFVCKRMVASDQGDHGDRGNCRGTLFLSWI